jgi:predicted component of type VI protein secretion system
VSSRHAAIIRQGDAFLLRDLGSKNGTRVNGRPLAGDVLLKDGDVIGFGPQGPTVAFHVLAAGAGDDVSDGARASAARLASMRDQVPAVAAGPARPSATGRIAAEVQRQTRELRRTTQVLLVLLLVSAGGFGWVRWNGARSARDVAALQARADSLNRAAQQLLGRLQSELQSLRDALRGSEVEAARLRARAAMRPRSRASAPSSRPPRRGSAASRTPPLSTTGPSPT